MTARLQIATWRDALRDSGLDRDAKSIGFVLSTFVNGNLSCYPSRRTIAAGGSVSVRTVDRAIPKLVLTGFLKVTKSRGRHSNGYLLIVPTATGETPLTATPGALLGSPQRRQNAPPTATPRGPESVKAKAKTFKGDADASDRESDAINARSQSRPREEAASGDLAYLDG